MKRTVNAACRQVECTGCGARPGQHCTSASGRSTAPHAPRWDEAKAQRLLPWQRPTSPYFPDWPPPVIADNLPDVHYAPHFPAL